MKHFEVEGFNFDKLKAVKPEPAEALKAHALRVLAHNHIAGHTTLFTGIALTELDFHNEAHQDFALKLARKIKALHEGTKLEYENYTPSIVPSKGIMRAEKHFPVINFEPKHR